MPAGILGPMTDKSTLGDRMKLYEGQESGRRFLPLLPVCARLDGKAFHTFTRGLRRPFDERMSRLMIDTTRFLVDQTNAAVGYTQSDEISLLWHPADPRIQIFMDGRIQKMTSILASIATAFFNDRLPSALPDKVGTLAFFDCRVWTVPNRDEAANAVLWREQDATKNSISMAAQAHFPHAELAGRTGPQMQEMLFTRSGVNWNDYPAFFRRGVYVQRRTKVRPFHVEELASLPERHEARTNPDLVVERSEVVELDLPPLAQVTNRVEVLFEGAEPLVGAAPTGSGPCEPGSRPSSAGSGS